MIDMEKKKISSAKSLANRIIKTHNKYDALCRELTSYLSKNADFDFYGYNVELHRGDGLCLCHDGGVANVEDLIDIIKQKGILSENDFWHFAY